VFLLQRCARWALVAFSIATAQGAEPGSEADIRLGLPPVPTQESAVATRRVINLGQRLFFDTRLSADGKVSCGKCHIPSHAFTDGRARSLGRDDRIGTRNAPSLLNVAFLDTLFWDGRATDLESQAHAPLTNPVEHALSSDAELLEIIRRDPSYVEDFATAFDAGPDHIDSAMVARALAAYERSLLAGGSPFDRYLYGGDATALSVGAVRGLNLFRGRAKCSACHTISDTSALLTDNQFHVGPMGLSQSITGKLAEVTKLVVTTSRSGNHAEIERLIAAHPDIAALGRFVVTLLPADIGKFKTPSLRDVALTAPYMHDGSIATLAAAVDQELYSRGKALNYPIQLTADERRDLLTFLDTLTSPHTRP
jgi:cytochrome c peroxidase